MTRGEVKQMLGQVMYTTHVDWCSKHATRICTCPSVQCHVRMPQLGVWSSVAEHDSTLARTYRLTRKRRPYTLVDDL